MPGQMAHILYAQRYLESHPGIDVPRFLRGTLFADSRRVTKIGRNRTHWHGESLASVEAETDPWQAGLKFHNWLDDTWNECFYQYGLQFGRAPDEATWLALKLVADKQSFPQIQNLPTVISALQTIGPEELTYTNKTLATHWYQSVASYIAGAPTIKTTTEFAEKIGLEEDDALALFQSFGPDSPWIQRVKDCDRELTAQIAHALRS